MGVGKGGGADFLKTPTGILKIIEFVCCFGAIIAAMIYSTSWVGDVTKLFNISAIFGAAYAFIFLICALCGAIDPKAKWNTIIDICLCILLLISASIYAVSFAHHGKDPEAYQGATVLQFLGGIAYFIEAILAILEIG